jgi:transposase
MQAELLAAVTSTTITKAALSNYDWLKKFFENGHLAFANGRKSKAVEDANLEKIQKLEAKLARKNEVMAELMEAHTQLKKDLGEL